MAAQICESCKHKYDGSRCYCSPNSVCDKYEEQVMAHWIVKAGYLYECSNCGTAWNDDFYGVSDLNRCPKCKAFINKKITYKNEKVDVDDVMIKAANKAIITSHQLLDVLMQQGLMGVYNLGLKHMYEYLKGDAS